MVWYEALTSVSHSEGVYGPPPHLSRRKQGEAGEAPTIGSKANCEFSQEILKFFSQEILKANRLCLIQKNFFHIKLIQTLS